MEGKTGKILLYGCFILLFFEAAAFLELNINTGAAGFLNLSGDFGKQSNLLIFFILCIILTLMSIFAAVHLLSGREVISGHNKESFVIKPSSSPIKEVKTNKQVYIDE